MELPPGVTAISAKSPAGFMVNQDASSFTACLSTLRLRTRLRKRWVTRLTGGTTHTCGLHLLFKLLRGRYDLLAVKPDGLRNRAENCCATRYAHDLHVDGIGGDL